MNFLCCWFDESPSFDLPIEKRDFRISEIGCIHWQSKSMRLVLYVKGKHTINKYYIERKNEDRQVGNDKQTVTWICRN